jgi:hypothetical protein
LTEALTEVEAFQKEERDLSSMCMEGEVKISEVDLASKEETISRLMGELELLQTELITANQCVEEYESEIQALQLVQEQAQGEAAEMVARLNIAAQELNAQQKILDLMKIEESERLNATANVGSTDDQVRVKVRVR